ncbi:hypothetical protein IAR55_007131 [Kwoniella newhampshirensis]|uniref:SANT domain-containing protein n=1 Tax=Kwoniella newhampshirensis TaxID=1651941 RepID=A0AAW0YHU5_9TREE
MFEPEAGPSRPSSSGSQWYIHHLESHTDSSRRHSLGQPGREKHHTPVGQFLSHVSYIGPSDTIWTANEKTLFFAALSRYSRHRVDLIARDIKTKSEIEVEWYLELLMGAGADERRQVTDRKMNKRDRRVRWDSSQTWREGLAPAAREVSDTWVEKEEKLAESVIDSVTRREEEHDERLKRQRRRAEKRAIGQSVHDDAELKPHQKRLIMETGEYVKVLEKRWKLEDWIEEIDMEKLATLNKLLQPAWSDWSARRRHSPSPARPRMNPSFDSEPESEDGDTVNHNGINGTSSHTPVKGDPQGKIARDRHDYEILSAIPKKDLSCEQRRQLGAILNRQRARERYRTKKLLDAGMTMEEIEKEGGADAVFAKREGRAESIQTTSTTLLGTVRTAPKIHQEKAADELKETGIYEYATACGIEVFNYHWMSKIVNRIASGTPPKLSFVIFHRLHNGLLNYLRPLLYSAIVIAEQRFMQGPSNDTEPSMTAEHVQQALSLLGKAHPFESVQDSVADLFQDDGVELSNDDDEEESESESDPANIRRARYRRSVLPPTTASWDMMVDLPPQEQNDVPANSLDDEREIVDDLGDAATEIEDGEIDAALEKLDEIHDETFEAELWKAVEADDPKAEPNDGGDVWMARSTQRMLGGRSRKRIAAEREYIKLLLHLDEERRRRRLDVRRQRKFPTTRLKKKARRYKGTKTDEWIVDSDSEEEDVDFGSDEGGEDAEMSDLYPEDDEAIYDENLGEEASENSGDSDEGPRIMGDGETEDGEGSDEDGDMEEKEDEEDV